MFRDTIDAASVYPREVAKEALIKNAAALILTQNHPSGTTSEPLQADKRITSRLVEALALLDIRIQDHTVVSTTDTTSFAEPGLL